MKHLKHLLIASTVTALCACNNTKESPVSLQWEMVKNGAAPGFYESSFTITNTSTKPLESDWEIYYTQLSPRQVKANEDSPVIIEMINAGYYKIAPWKISFTSCLSYIISLRSNFHASIALIFKS